jgi:hypothetical protein
MKMQNKRTWISVIVGALWSLSSAQNPAIPSKPASALYITHVTVIDTRTGTEARDRTVVISGDRVKEVTDSKDMKTPAGATVLDRTGKYLIPGLWDMHVHGNNQPWFATMFPLYLANGVTGIREMFGPMDANEFRAQLAAKGIDAPHMYLGSPIIDGDPPAWPTSIVVTTPNDGRKVVEEQKGKGADFIKIYNNLSREAYFAIMDESRHQKIPVQGHVPRRISAWEASAAHQRSFEHLSGIPLACSSREEELVAKYLAARSGTERYRLMLDGSRSYVDRKCRRLFAELKKNSTWQVPTLTVNRAFGMLQDPQFTRDDRSRYFSGELKEWLTAKDDPRLKNWTSEDFAVRRELFAYYRKVLGAMFRAGVPILAGTDTGNPYCYPGFSLHDELALMVESGVTPLGALQAATWNAARFMDASDRYGSVTPGKIADLVLLDADPLTDIHNTTRISAVFLAGKHFDRAALDEMLGAAEAAAKLASIN